MVFCYTCILEEITHKHNCQFPLPIAWLSLQPRKPDSRALWVLNDASQKCLYSYDYAMVDITIVDTIIRPPQRKWIQTG